MSDTKILEARITEFEKSLAEARRMVAIYSNAHDAALITIAALQEKYGGALVQIEILKHRHRVAR